METHFVKAIINQNLSANLTMKNITHSIIATQRVERSDIRANPNRRLHKHRALIQLIKKELTPVYNEDS